MVAISIIIPAYNEEAFLAATLQAIFSQDYEHFEVLVVDNGSSDRTAEIARTFPVQLLHEKRQGTMWACECGRKQATGDIIVRMDADCLPPSDWLRRGVAHFAHPHIVSASGPYDYFDGAPSFRRNSLFVQKYFYPIVNSFLHITRRGAVIIGGNSFMRADALEAIGGFNTAITFYGDDTDTAQKLSVHGKIIFDKNLIMPTSARRFNNEGVLKTTLNYARGFVIALRSASKKKDASLNSIIYQPLQTKSMIKKSSHLS